LETRPQAEGLPHGAQKNSRCKASFAAWRSASEISRTSVILQNLAGARERGSYFEH